MSPLLTSATWYQAFNLVEALLWVLVSIIVLWKTPCANRQQVWAARLGAVSFLVFGISDVLECQHQASIPLWLWGLKTLCGCGLLAARYMWKGWDQFHWTDREFLFGLGCLLAVLALISLQHFPVERFLVRSTNSLECTMLLQHMHQMSPLFEFKRETRWLTHIPSCITPCGPDWSARNRVRTTRPFLWIGCWS